jgi:hypothetical protein
VDVRNGGHGLSYTPSLISLSFCPPHPPLIDVAMSSNNSPSSSSTFGQIFGVALNKYKDLTGEALLKTPFAETIRCCGSSDDPTAAALDVFRNLIEAQTIRSDKSQLMEFLEGIVDSLGTLSGIDGLSYAVFVSLTL